MMKTFSTEMIPIATLPSGDLLTTHAIRIRGGEGKKAYIQANNHGGEIAGNFAILELLKILRQGEIDGELVIIPHVNPVSLLQKTRGSRQGVYDDQTGLNFNRQFKLLVGGESGIDLQQFVRQHLNDDWKDLRAAYKRELGAALERFRAKASDHGMSWRDRFAYELQKRSHDADLVLDLHTGDVAPRYLYAFQGEMNQAIFLNSPHTLVMEDEKFGGAADEAHFVPWSLLRNALAKEGREVAIDVESYTIELGSIETLDLDDAQRDAANLANYLRHHRILRGEADFPKMNRYACRLSDYVVYHATASGLAQFRKAPGEKVRSGEVVAEIYSMRSIDSFDAIDRVATPVKAVTDGILVTRHRSPIVMEGTELFKLMTNVWEL